MQTKLQLSPDPSRVSNLPTAVMVPKGSTERPEKTSHGRKNRRTGACATAPDNARKRRPKSNTLVIRRKVGQTKEAAEAELAVGGLESNTAIAVRLSSGLLGELDLTECLTALRNSVERVHAGNLHDQEAHLAAQAVTLNALFVDLMRRAIGSEYLTQFESYMRLGLKAQSQCRATIETLAVVKNPPTVFARQANIAQGPQHVNNTVTLARAEHPESGPNELLEAQGEWLDVGTTRAAGGSHSALATVGTVNLPENG